MKIFVISLVTAADRRSSVTAQFRDIGLPFEFFDAVDGSNGLDGYFDGIDERTYRLNTYRDPLPGELGCYASHLALWQRAVDLDEPIVILEDDCKIEHNFLDALSAVARVIQEFGFIRLQGFSRATPLKSVQPSHFVAQIDSFGIHYLSNVPLCLLAYAVSPASARQLVKSSIRIKAPVDKFVQRTWEHGTPIFAMSPECVTTSDLAAATTIGSRKTRKKNKVGLAFRRAHYKLKGEIERRRFDKQQLELLSARQQLSE